MIAQGRSLLELGCRNQQLLSSRLKRYNALGMQIGFSTQPFAEARCADAYG